MMRGATEKMGRPDRERFVVLSMPGDIFPKLPVLCQGSTPVSSADASSKERGFVSRGIRGSFVNLAFYCLCSCLRGVGAGS